MAVLKKHGNRILVTPPGVGKHTQIKEVLGGRKYGNGYLLQPTVLNICTLVDWYGSDILEGSSTDIVDLYFKEWGFRENAERVAEAESHPWWENLYEFQQDAVRYLVSNPHQGAILSLPPGWGKAPASIVAMDAICAFKVLIVAPLTLARNWQAELDKWSRYYRSWSRATRSMKDPVTECVVTNHEVLFEPAWTDEYGEPVVIEDGRAFTFDKEGNEEWIKASPVNMKNWILEGPTQKNKRTGKSEPKRKRTVKLRSTYDQDWDLIIVDESVLLKNRRAIKVDMVLQLAKYANQVWLLSGAPTTKTRADLFPQCKVIMPAAFTSYWRFVEFFCVVDKSGWGWTITNDRPDHDPHKYLKDFLYVPPSTAKLELPDYIYDPIEIDLNADQEKAFHQMSKKWYAELEESKTVTAAIALAQMTRLAQITSNMVNIGGKNSSAKEDLLLTLVEENDIEYPMVIWCWWVPTTVSIFDRLVSKTDLNVDYVTGNMKSDDKDEALDAYKSNQTDILVLQMGVGKFGHTLTNTRTVFYHDRHFDSDAYFQSLHRVKRIGLTQSPRLIVPRAPRSFDPAVELNLAGKLESIAKLGRHDLQKLLLSLGSGLVPWSLNEAELLD